MPHSLIILENHQDTSAYQFLFDNAENLYALGYTQMLFELYCNHEPSVYMDTLRKNLPFAKKSLASQSAELILRTYDKFCELGFMCRFIDPESEDIAMRYNRQLEKASNENNLQQFESISAQRWEATRQRDLVMANCIVEANESSRAKGGVIFVGGFQHNNLIKQLEIHAARTKQIFRYAIFHSKPLYYDTAKLYSNQSAWYNIQDISYRTTFYGIDSVNYIDPSKYTFEMIKATLMLSFSVPCPEDTPSIRFHMKEKTGFTFEFTRDEQNIVSANLDMKCTEEAIIAKKIRDVFPGLHFFSQRTPGTDNTRLCIPGTNLVDQRTKIL